ncbi:hypothetical protein V8C44DRAFT_261980 [Trichoderma aethiopicum]
MKCFAPRDSAFYTTQEYGYKHAVSTLSKQYLRACIAINAVNQVVSRHITIRSTAKKQTNLTLASPCPPTSEQPLNPPPSQSFEIDKHKRNSGNSIKAGSQLKADAHPSPTQPSQCLLHASNPDMHPTAAGCLTASCLARSDEQLVI